MFSLLSFGEALVDFLPDNIEATSYTPLAGGAPANVAVAFAKLGGNSYFAGGISTDNFGTMLMQQLTEYGVNTSFVSQISDAISAIVLVGLDQTGERSFNFYRHHTADTQYTSADIANINWRDIGVFHFCSNTLTDETMYQNTLCAIKAAKSQNALISFDVNLRQQLWDDLTLLPARVSACIEKSDIIKLSKDEAQYLAQLQQLNIEQYTSQLLAQGVKLVVITDGANAVQFISPSFAGQQKVPEIKALDTTAAGDSFIASLLFYLTQYAGSNAIRVIQTIEKQALVTAAVKFASQCGALTCQRKGAFTALPLITEL
ncbi:fructokinase [Thalassotalea insulae]|uniref:Fructokinase n=1 Tax=Thalassotalea insulae TaxID=2056778 RepID=A0ABQ6GX09_9GAMM|nr:carbohydrate kinase [Thalassotalea insulae]GLX78696.1 fructokinase [Thalassotalea insulae]